MNSTPALRIVRDTSGSKAAVRLRMTNVATELIVHNPLMYAFAL
jgi:hypothetical protein